MEQEGELVPDPNGSTVPGYHVSLLQGHHLESIHTTAQPKKKQNKVQTTTATHPVHNLDSTQYLYDLPQLPSPHQINATDSTIDKSLTLDADDLKSTNPAPGSDCSSRLPSPGQIFHTLPDLSVQTLPHANFDCDDNLGSLTRSFSLPDQADQDQQENLMANNSNNSFPPCLQEFNTVSTKPPTFNRLVDYDSEHSFSTNVSQASRPPTPPHDCLPDPLLLPPDSLTHKTTPL
ncbi:uncharacterized protein MELLADRAFT_69899 [Melampsora larici-populina 98AG31]|uniref:Uncharacterized protein n=1 Tax=Melampsora larici-populina (strain 98AG31 / pathotype 3-4-7) TaxID=747676 RepID=F4SCP7_MELLP|nr:uncharacterized protein MELLADRAFT_69899 [Melampsora larici-populina 98AG31]EGF97583.1 hypothetical protein MELLADRAFT_69899 [Melampsora larici-populina 98AG31]